MSSTLPVYNTPVVTPDGTMTQPWFEFFRDLLRSVTGPPFVIPTPPAPIITIVNQNTTLIWLDSN